MSEIVKKYTKGDETLTIKYDESPESPREWDNLGTCVFLGGYSNLGDKHDIDNVKDANRIEKKHISLPVYMYSHSGETIATTPFSCPWDSGKLGFIYITNEKVRNEYGWKRISAKRKEQILGYLKNEITTLDHYVRGDVYGFEHNKLDEELDSCWGFYGDNFNQIFDEIDEKIEDWTEVEIED
jgi:hypothetical protein